MEIHCQFKCIFLGPEYQVHGDSDNSEDTEEEKAPEVVDPGLSSVIFSTSADTLETFVSCHVRVKLPEDDTED